MAKDTPENHPDYRDFSESLAPQDKIDLSQRFCSRPFDHVEIMHGWGDNQANNFGEVFVCCSGWLSKPIGNYLKSDLRELWNSQAVQDIRESILDGSFKYCNKQACCLIQNDQLPWKKDLSGRYKKIVEQNQKVLDELPASYFLCYDRSCNLQCPSCRNGLIFFKSGDGYDLPKRLTTKLLSDLFDAPSDRRINLNVTGSGDPFASPAFKELLETINGDDFPNLEVSLFTNGLLFTPSNWQKLQHIHHQITLVSVSIDAATEPTYKKVRGGSWQMLEKSLQFLAELRRQGQLRNLWFNYVVQTENFREIADFVRMGLHYSVDRIDFSLVSDWKTWSREEFERQCIWKTSHPLYEELLMSLQDDVLDHKIAKLGALAPYRAEGARRLRERGLNRDPGGGIGQARL